MVIVNKGRDRMEIGVITVVNVSEDIEELD
jgi:hypothetical protein